MGGPKSGRYRTRTAGVQEDVPGLSVRQLQQAGMLDTESIRYFTLSSPDDPRSQQFAISRASRGGVWIAEPSDGPRRGEGTHVGVRWVPCRFGGLQPYFRCPVCARSTVALVRMNGAWGCRVCSRLSYRSQHQNPSDRKQARVALLRAALDPAAAHDAVAPPKRPKGMHRTTYLAHLERLAAAEDALTAATGETADRLAEKEAARARRTQDR